MATLALLLLILIPFLVWLTCRDQPQRDAAAAQEWARFYEYAHIYKLDLLYIERDYQHAHQGSKALVSLYTNPARTRDAWFWWTQVQKGSVVAVRFSQGWGPHTQRDDVLYIGHEATNQTGIYATLGAKTLARAHRHHQRTNMQSAAIRPSTWN
jgi:hypothetical protein